MGTYSYSGTPVDVTVTTTGVYTISGYGGAGGNATANGSTGGTGEKVSADFQLQAGEKLEIFVGGAGGNGTAAGGGGGGTFVLASTDGGATYHPLVVAGGGGGATTNFGAGGAGRGISPSDGNVGGTAHGGYGGGGAGFVGNGGNGFSYGTGGSGGIAVTYATTPGAGGVYRNIFSGQQTSSGNGGFGGGGAGSGRSNSGGGGGGYKGGNSGQGFSADGGTSFLASDATKTFTGSAAVENGAHAGNGQVTITPVETGRVYGYTGAPVRFTATSGGTYQVVAYGAAGGKARYSGPVIAQGGSGAMVSGTITLTPGERVEIFVGGAGKTGTTNGYGYAGGGGGGTFVLASTDNGASYHPLVIAGGGGGAGSRTGDGGAASTTLSSSGGAGGTASGHYGGGGGAGLTGNGGSGYHRAGGGYGGGGTSVSNPTNPGAGGTSTGSAQGYAAAGGFGGGGGAGPGHGGGGGGYTGGDASGYSSQPGASGPKYTGIPTSTGGTSYLTSDATTGAIASAASENAANGGNGEVIVRAVCFAAGTRIRTTRGDVAVEALSIGDDVVTASGAHRPIRWLGHRRIDLRRHPIDSDALPVRISAHAFGRDRPARDLFVSPGHALCLDILGEVLVPAVTLVNGATIQQVEVDEIAYWHVELDSHDILIAENLPTESYLDMGNRGFFREADIVDLAAGPDVDPSWCTHRDFCRPFHAGGRLVETVRDQLRVRAETIGWALDDRLEMHLEVDGRRIEPTLRASSALFHIAAGAADVWLVSPKARPCDATESGDVRELGLCLRSLRIADGWSEPRNIAIDDRLLCVGFHDVEDGVRRWTAGRARLPVELWAGCEDGFYLRVDLAGSPVPRWAAPATTHECTANDFDANLVSTA